MITVRTKGVPLKKELPVDDEGYSVFNLDETKFDPFEVLLATMAKCGYVAPESDPRFEEMQRRRKQREQEESRAARTSR